MLFIVILILVVVIVLYSIEIKYEILEHEKKVRETFDVLNNHYKKRHELITELMIIFNFEDEKDKAIISDIIRFKNRVNNNLLISNIIIMNTELEKRLEQLYEHIESSSKYSKDESYIKLKKSFDDVTREIERDSRYYNLGVDLYNNFINLFPNRIIADKMNKTEYEKIEIK